MGNIDEIDNITNSKTYNNTHLNMVTNDVGKSLKLGAVFPHAKKPACAYPNRTTAKHKTRTAKARALLANRVANCPIFCVT